MNAEFYLNISTSSQERMCLCVCVYWCVYPLPRWVRLNTFDDGANICL